LAKWDLSKLPEGRKPLPDEWFREHAELEAENKRLKSMIADVIYDTGDDPEIMAASRAEWAARALTAEAKLAQAVGLVDDMVEWGTWYGEALKEILHRLAELKGKKPTA
jgi:hypothetical protein